MQSPGRCSHFEKNNYQLCGPNNRETKDSQLVFVTHMGKHVVFLSLTCASTCQGGGGKFVSRFLCAFYLVLAHLVAVKDGFLDENGCSKG